MGSRLKLEVFFDPPHRFEAAVGQVAADSLEDARLSAYETGYSAGWDDATAAQSADQSRIHAEFAHNLQLLSFTYYEARSHVLRKLEPLLHDMVSKVLPAIAQDTLANFVLESLRPIALGLADVPVVLTMHPVNRPKIEALLTEECNLPIVISEEPTLSEGQVYIQLDNYERQVDLDGVIREIANAIESFFQLQNQEQAYG